MSKKWWTIIIIVVVVLIILAIPTGFLISINNSTYDCSFQYAKVDNLVNDIARKHLYYNAADKTVDIDLSQDMINSLIKDNMASLKLDLPKNFSIKEVLYSTKDQRLYINAKYGFLNTPISAKVNVKLLDTGIQISATDLKLGKMNAPGFIKGQIPADAMKYTINYADLGVPQVFTVKSIKYGTGVLTATIALDPDKIADLALTYRDDLMNQINTIKSSQSPLVATFLDKLLGTGVLSDAKVKEYVTNALGNEELVNSIKYFATASDLSKYSTSLSNAQKTVSTWAAPLSGIKSYGTIDETVAGILADQNLRSFLTWFLPDTTINQYAQTVTDYFQMYKDYLALYDQVTGSIDKAAKGIKVSDINDYAKILTDNANQFEDIRKFVKANIGKVDDNYLKSFVDQFEKGVPGADADLQDLKDARDFTKDFVQYTYVKEVDQFKNAVEDQRQYTVNFVNTLQKGDYEAAANRLSGSAYSPKMQAYIDSTNKEIDANDYNDFMNAIK